MVHFYIKPMTQNTNTFHFSTLPSNFYSENFYFLESEWLSLCHSFLKTFFYLMFASNYLINKSARELYAGDF